MNTNFMCEVTHA